eukprot:15183399-Ditylum_brightwellii.AAC.1
MKEGMIFAAYIKQDNRAETANAGAEGGRGLRLNVNKAHDLLGHSDEDKTRAPAKHLGWTITCGKMKPSKSCAVGKACQKNVSKTSQHVKAATPGERIFLDIATIKGQKGGPVVNSEKNWRIMVDEYSTLRLSDFYKTKSGMIGPTLEKINWWKQSGKEVKCIQCDNA